MSNEQAPPAPRNMKVGSSELDLIFEYAHTHATSRHEALRQLIQLGYASAADPETQKRMILGSLQRIESTLESVTKTVSA